MMKNLYPRAHLTSSTHKVIVHGNSLSYGVGTSSTAARWPDQAKLLSPLSGTGISVANASVSGASIETLGTAPATLISQAPTYVDPLLDATRTNILVVWEGINELTQNGINAQACINSYATYIAARRAAAASVGARLWVIVGTSTPARSASLTDEQMISRNSAFIAVNTALRVNFRAIGADDFADVAAIPQFKAIFDNGDYSKSVFQASGMYARSDGTADDFIHFGDAGYALAATAFAQAFKRVRL